jgi:hypothetical protein
MNDLALLALKLSILPDLFLVSYFAPTLLTYRQVFAFYLDVEFNVLAFAGFFPGIFTLFQSFALKPPVNYFLLLREMDKLRVGYREG